MRNLILIFVFSFFMIGCDNSDLKKFYFQMKDFEQSKTYVYVDQNNTSNIVNLKMYYKIIDSDTIFFTETINTDGKPNEVFVEKIDNSKCSMIDYYLINYNSDGEDNKLFAEKIKTEVYSYTLNSYPLVWEVKLGSQKWTKTRSILNNNSSIQIFNKNISCIIFKDEFKIEDENGITEFYQESYYAEGYGLVRYERFFGNNYVMNYMLKEIR